ncbi:MAG: helicase, partial [Desulfobulbaceae bacterium]
MQPLDELQQLREENGRLKALLTSHGIAWEEKTTPVPEPATQETGPFTAQLTIVEKIILFRRLFRGRTDVYPQRWESTKGTSGYSPVCGNEWKPGTCCKPKVKCGDCTQRQLLPITDQVIYDHLAGKHTVGVYPLLTYDRCYFLAADFDEADWREDARAFLLSCRELNIPAALEVSRSGNGAHVWIFFADPVPARE